MTWKCLRIAFFCLFCSFSFSCGVPQNESSQVESFNDPFEVRSFRFKSFDNAELSAKLFQPKSGQFSGPRPAVIFANSWTMNESEYDGLAKRLARKGYVVISYATRGFGTSDDVVTVGGPNDLRDVSSLIDWLEAHTDADIKNLAMGGLSYGAGLALLSAAHEPRIKTVVAVSGWGNLEGALYGGDTVRKTWAKLLIASGTLTGRLGPEIFENIARLKSNTEIEVVRKWAQDRSPLQVVDQINARQVPIFVANSYQDNLFPPLQMRLFYEKLSGPKMFFLDRGIHASSSFGGIYGLPNRIWDEAENWLDYWLRGVDSGISNQAPLSFFGKNGRELYSKFPAMHANKTDLILTPLNTSKTQKPDVEPETIASISFGGGLDSGATSGVPLIGETMEGVFGQPLKKHIARIDMRYAAVYTSPNLKKGGRLRGSPKLSIYLDPHKSPLQLIAYLYDVDSRGVGTLVCHGVFSRREGEPEATRVELDLGIAAYDIAPNHRLVVALDTLDPLYENPSSDHYSLSFKHADPEATSIEIPLLP